jgi:hypothetical protein
MGKSSFDSGLICKGERWEVEEISKQDTRAHSKKEPLSTLKLTTHYLMVPK